MLFVTWNVNSLKARLPRVLQFLAEHRPAVLCAQETKSSPAAFPHAELADAGYRAVDHSAGRWAGVAILARDDYELCDAVCGLPGEGQPGEARWCEATLIGGPGRDTELRVGSIYVPNGRAVGTETFDDKLVFLDALRKRLATAATGPLFVAGDFNVAPADIDVYDPAAFEGSTHTTAEERSRLSALLDLGLTDAYRHLQPYEVGYTWWDYRAGHFHKKLGLRIDLALVTPDLAARLRHCGIDRSYRKGPKPSDHAPLLVKFTEP